MICVVVLPLLGLAVFLPATMKRRNQHVGLRYLTYQRDSAGFNNVRLQLECMVAIAAVTTRLLVLPLPSRIAHLPDLFHEFMVFDASALYAVIGAAKHAPTDIGGCETKIYSSRLVDGIPGGLKAPCVLHVPTAVSRVTHFECIPWTPGQARIAFQAVLQGLRYHERFREWAQVASRVVGDAFIALHIRRGDFDQFRGEEQRSPSDVLRASVRETKSYTHMFVATDGTADYVDALSREASEMGVHIHTQETLGCAASTEVDRAVLDMHICAVAETFLGTPDSTFSLGVRHLRLQMAMDTGTLWNELPRTHLGVDAKTRGSAGETCWDKVTTASGFSLAP